MGDWLVDEIGKKGNVLVVEGIPGTSTSDSLDRGIKLGLATIPDVKIVGDVAGMWTDQVAQAEVQKWLANHPGDLDGVVVQSAAELGVLRALEQSGRKMPPVAIGGEEGALCYWRHHPKYVSAAIQGWPPADEMELTWNIMMRTLRRAGTEDPVGAGRFDQAQLRRCRRGLAGELQRGFRQVVHGRRRQVGRHEEPRQVLPASRRSGGLQEVSWRGSPGQRGVRDAAIARVDARRLRRVRDVAAVSSRAVGARDASCATAAAWRRGRGDG